MSSGRVERRSALLTLVRVSGSGSDTVSAPVSRIALVFLVLCINGSWKTPIGYFMTHGLSCTERANSVQQLFWRKQELVVALTCGGPSSYFTTLKQLGASMVPSQLSPSFLPHPTDQSQIVYD